MQIEQKNEKMTEGEAFKKIAYYCAYRERSIKETKDKLSGWEMEVEISERLIQKLQEERYLDEKRFAESYAGGKFRVKNWGRIKIKMGLKAHGISAEGIRNAIGTIPEEDYKQTLNDLFMAKLKELKNIQSAANKQKMYNYLCTKGFEPEQVLQMIHSTK